MMLKMLNRWVSANAPASATHILSAPKARACHDTGRARITMRIKFLFFADLRAPHLPTFNTLKLDLETKNLTFVPPHALSLVSLPIALMLFEPHALDAYRVFFALSLPTLQSME